MWCWNRDVSKNFNLKEFDCILKYVKILLQHFDHLYKSIFYINTNPNITSYAATKTHHAGLIIYIKKNLNIYDSSIATGHIFFFTKQLLSIKYNIQRLHFYKYPFLPNNPAILPSHTDIEFNKTSKKFIQFIPVPSKRISTKNLFQTLFSVKITLLRVYNSLHISISATIRKSYYVKIANPKWDVNLTAVLDSLNLMKHAAWAFTEIKKIFALHSCILGTKKKRKKSEGKKILSKLTQWRILHRHISSFLYEILSKYAVPFWNAFITSFFLTLPPLHPTTSTTIFYFRARAYRAYIWIERGGKEGATWWTK